MSTEKTTLKVDELGRRYGRALTALVGVNVSGRTAIMAVSALSSIIVEAVMDDMSVRLSGLGMFKPHVRARGRAWNPVTKKAFTRTEKLLILFSATPRIKRALAEFHEVKKRQGGGR